MRDVRRDLSNDLKLLPLATLVKEELVLLSCYSQAALEGHVPNTLVSIKYLVYTCPCVFPSQHKCLVINAWYMFF